MNQASINERRFVFRAARLMENEEEELNQASIDATKDNALYLISRGRRTKEIRGLYDQVAKCEPRASLAEKETQGTDVLDPVVQEKSQKTKKKCDRFERKKDKDNVEGTSATKEGDTTTAEGITSLLQQSADMDAQEIEQERMKHDELLFHMSDLVSGLKDTTLLMNKMVVEQNVNLSEIQQEAGQNIEELEQQKDKMKQETDKMTMSFWTTLYTAAWLIGMFVATYLVIKIFPAPRR